MKMSKAEAGKIGAIASIKITQEKKEQRIKDYFNNPSACKKCNSVLPYNKRRNLFCSSSCFASANNVLRKKPSLNTCLSCKKKIGNKSKFCSVRCQKEYQYKSTILQWLDGIKPAGFGAVKRYLTETVGYKCSSCGITEYNGKPIVLELEHKDGNSSNTQINNLCFLCPNCHSQTPTYKNRNKGKGRHARRQRYREGKSY